MELKVTSAVCIAAILTATSTPCQASEPPGMGAIAVDAVVVRPACFIVTIVGAALFVVALPVAATSKSVKQTGDALVARPFRATFKRPMGDLDALEQGGQKTSAEAGSAQAK